MHNRNMVCWVKDAMLPDVIVCQVSHILSLSDIVCQILVCQMILFVPLHTLGHGGIVWCGTQWLVCLVWYGMVGMPGMPPSL